MRLSPGQRAGFNLSQLVREASQKTGCTPRGDPLWQQYEVELLRAHYPDLDLLVRLLPHRTRKAIELAAQRRGLSRKLHVWTGVEVTRLRRLAREGATKAEFLDAFPGLRWKQIASALSKRGIRRRRSPLKVFGEPIFDEVRRLARAHGMFVYELAETTRSGGYFRKRPTRRNWKHLAAGVEMFGGEVFVRWSEPEALGAQPPPQS